MEEAQTCNFLRDVFGETIVLERHPIKEPKMSNDLDGFWILGEIRFLGVQPCDTLGCRVILWELTTQPPQERKEKEGERP